MTVNKNKLENYAKLAVEFGVNVQKNEDVLINSSLEDPTLARLIAKYAYEKGARLVSINWKDEELTKLKDLLDTGVISQEEFDAKKKQILGV